MCVALYRSPKIASLATGSAVVCLVLGVLGYDRAVAKDLALRGSVYFEHRTAAAEPTAEQAFEVAPQHEIHLRLQPISEDWVPYHAPIDVVPEPSLLGLSYSLRSGLAYQYSDRTHFNLDLDLWSVRLGVSRQFAIPAGGAQTQLFW